MADSASPESTSVEPTSVDSTSVESGAAEPTGADQGLAPVIVLAGGLSHERDVSLRSGRRVAIALREAGHQVFERDVTADLVPTLQQHPDAVAFPLLHGGVGEDGALREVLGLLGVPFVGSSAAASRLAYDKSVATPIVATRGVSTPRQIALPHDMFRELGAAALVQALAEQIGFPMMVKPARSGSALGATRVDTIDELPSAMVGAYAYGATAVIEHYVDGTEVAVTVVDAGAGAGPERTALPSVEIVPMSGVYDYASRYTAGETRFIAPARFGQATESACRQMALQVGDALGVSGLYRVDIIVDSSGAPQFLEVNTAPGMTETSSVPLAIEAGGLDVGAVCSALVQQAASAR